MSPRVILLALFFTLTLLPQGWNKFDNTNHALLIYALGATLLALLFLSWRQLWNEKFERVKKISAENLIKIASLLLPILLVTSFAFSPIQNLGWSEVMVMAASVAIFIIAQTFSEKEKKSLLRIFLALATICAIAGFWQYLTRIEPRIAGPMFDAAWKAHYWPNAFALMLLMCWPLALHLNITRAMTIRHALLGRISFPEITIPLGQILKALLISILLSALLLTFSRMAFLVLIIQITAYCWFIRREFFQKKTLIFLATTLFLTLTITATLHMIRAANTNTPANDFTNKITFSGTEQQTSLIERRDFMLGTLRLIPQHPWLGSGPFSFRFIYPKIQQDFLAISDHPHNWYLKIALEEGIPALLIFLVLIGAVLYPHRNLLTESSITEQNTVSLPAILTLSVLGALIHNLADYNMNFLSNQILFWIILACLVQASDQRQDEKQQYNRSKKIWPLVVAIAIVLISSSLLIEGYYSFTKQYEKMRFPRSYFFEEARYAVTEKGDFTEGISLLEHHLSLNPFDAFAWNYLGHVQEYIDRNAALKSYEQAIKSDPANFFNFYLDYVKLAKKMKKTDTENYKFFTKKAITFLEKYPEKIRNNIHYTAKTANSGYAIELARLLGERKILLQLEKELRRYKLKK